MATQPDLLDVNVWLALGVHDHPDHERASRYWRQEASDQLAFCRVTTLGLLRLLTNAAVMRGQPLTAAQAWQAYGAFRQQPGVALVAEPAGCEALLERWVAAGQVHPRLWTDAYLAAVARAGEMRLISFDADFARFEGLTLLHLRASE